MSTFEPHLEPSRSTALAALALLVVSLSLPALADEPKKIRKLGNPVTAFSTQPADSLDNLRSQFNANRADLETAIRHSGWEGDSADLFAAVQNGKVDRVQVPVGEKLQWMAFRKNKQPTTTSNLVWAGKEPFDAWQFQFESNDKTYDFLVPVVCLNLALYEVGPASPPPSCDLSASVGAAECDQLSQISLNGGTDGTKLEITGVRGGSGSSGLSSAGGNRWTYAPSAAGSYEFTATATSAHGKTTTCSASATVAAADPCVTCKIDASYDADSRTVTVADGGSVGTLDVTGFTLPDGSSGDMSKLIAAGGDRWTYTHKKQRKPGSYTWTFAARAERSGKTDDCDAAVTLDVPEPDYAWIFRAVAARVDADDSASSSIFLADGSNQRDFFQVGPGYGFGASIERVFSPRVGLELGVLIADLDSQLMRDIDEAWETSDKDVGMTLISLGPNFHLTPGSSVDLYIGPFLGWVDLDDITHRVLGSSVRSSSEDEFTWGAQIGLDVPTSSSWAFTAGIKYLDLSYDLGREDAGSEVLDLALDPLIFTAGVAYRF